MIPKHIYLLLLIALLLMIGIRTYPQDKLQQTIKGIIVDKQSQMPLIGATVVLLNSDPLVGAVTDVEGQFRLENIPIGRLDIQVSYIGYNSLVLNNLLLSSGKELVLNIDLEENIFTTKEVVIKAYSRKDRPINKMATISARSFTVEETSRYAGSYGDPARMAANYAGVMTGRDNRNDIVIRGNSSMNILWRLDDIEIPNPSHYAALGTTGGPISILNNNLLTNSDFLTGAFPAEYGNVLAGVFDLKMRRGNNEKREHWVQLGWNGLEIGTEGPFSIERSKASYLIAYRYSVLEILNVLGVDLGINPKYQDLTFKINIPTKKGKFDIFGIGGRSQINIFDSNKDQEDWLFENSGENIANGSDIGVLALSNLHFLNEKTRIRTYVTVMGSVVSSQIDTFNINNIEQPGTQAGERSSEIKYSFSTTLKKKFNARNDAEIGVIYDIYNYNYKDSTYINNQYIKDTDAKGSMNMLRAFTQLRHKFSSKLSLISGVNYQLLTFNNSFAVEPRLGLKWNINEIQSLGFGFGVHSQMQPRMFYYIQSQLPDGTYLQSNNGLDFSKSNHFVLGYDYLLSENLRLKIEGYYQALYDIPVKQSMPAYSLLNSGVEYFVGREDSLVNQGTGENYGIELTLERFFHDKYYFLITTSIFNSVYKGYDKIERNTAFNTNFIFNAVGGYEFAIGKRKNGLLSIGLKATWTGGRPYIPFDVDGSVLQGREVLDWGNAYAKRYKEYKRASIRVGIKRNKKKLNMEFIFDFQYRTNYTNVYIERLDVTTGKIMNYQEMGFYPMSTWRIQF